MNFADEVTLGTALSRIMNASRPAANEIELFGVDVPRIRRIIDSIPEDGYIQPHYVQALLHAAGIPMVEEFVSANKDEVLAFVRRTGFPVVAKVVGPVHKSDVGGVVLNIKGEEHLAFEFERMMQIPEVTGILIQPMLTGTELFGKSAKACIRQMRKRRIRCFISFRSGYAHLLQPHISPLPVAD